MYAKRLGLKREPFSIAPDPHSLYMSERHREALAHLLYGVKGGGGFVLLTGEIGAGKTTVCRAFLEQVPKRCNVAYIYNPLLNAQELLRTVLNEFRVPLPEGDEPSLKEHVDALNEYLLRTHAVGQNNLLIIDEAQNLSPPLLEQLRLLTNLETNERKLLQIVLIGQPELRELVGAPGMEQLAQRVIARCHLQALGEADTLAYIRHRLAAAGWNGPMLFDGPSLKLVHRISRGIPRRINLLCDRALLGAYAQGTRRVREPMVRKAAQEVFGESLQEERFRHWRAQAPALLAGLLIGLAVAGVALLWHSRLATGPQLATPRVALPAEPTAAGPLAAPDPGGPALRMADELRRLDASAPAAPRRQSGAAAP